MKALCAILSALEFYNIIVSSKYEKYKCIIFKIV